MYDLPFDTEISGVCVDSRKVEKGSLFICINGECEDGHKYAKEALEKGAALVVCERDLGLEKSAVVRNTRVEAARIFSAFYERPERELPIAAVTGTNGKTSVTFMLGAIYDAIGVKNGIIGTLGCYRPDGITRTENTTPGPEVLYKELRRMRDAGCEKVFMEVSSHAKVLGRVEPIEFDCGIYTCLTRDHLDFHKSMDEYARVKESILNRCKRGIFNTDDETVVGAYRRYGGERISFGLNLRADVFAQDIKYLEQGVRYTVDCFGEKREVIVRSSGIFGVYNSLAAIAFAAADNVELDKALEALTRFSGVEGRMEKVYDGEFTVIIDFAHTPDAMEKAIECVRQSYTQRPLTLVFGCGGDRDKGKRKRMGEISRSAEKVIVTSDNVRFEKGEDIISEILSGNESALAIKDRRNALEYAIDTAEKGDVILITGKGHEHYEIVKNRKISFSEREIIRDRIKNKEM